MASGHGGKSYGSTELEVGDDSDYRVERSAPRRNRTYGRALVFGAVVTVSFLAIAGLATQRQEVVAEELAAKRAFSAGGKNQGWYIYKAAWAGARNTTDGLLKFMAEHAGGLTCDKDPLGCGGYKITCNWGAQVSGGKVGIDKQLHYVVADRLPSQAVDGDNLGVDGWIAEAMADMGNMNEFTAMMHNKVQVFMVDLEKQITNLEKSGNSLMFRKSRNTDGVLMGHVLVPVAGMVWEFVGRLAHVTDPNRFKFWSNEECPAAHAVDLNLTHVEDVMKAEYGNSSTGGVSSDTPARPRSEWFGISSPASSVGSEEYLTLFSHLKLVTGAVVQEERYEYCDVVSVHYQDSEEWAKGGSIGQDIKLKYVTNRAKQTLRSGKTIKDFENYITRVHDRFLTQKTEPTYGADGEKSERFRGWDHWLDSHIGVKYAGAASAKSADQITELNEICFKTGEELTATLITDDIPVGKRYVETDGDHYYSGYSGMLMAMEYNTECHFGAHTSDLCTCVPTNSDLDYIALHPNSTNVCSIIVEMDAKAYINETIYSSPLPN